MLRPAGVWRVRIALRVTEVYEMSVLVLLGGVAVDTEMEIDEEGQEIATCGHTQSPWRISP